MTPKNTHVPTQKETDIHICLARTEATILNEQDKVNLHANDIFETGHDQETEPMDFTRLDESRFCSPGPPSSGVQLKLRRERRRRGCDEERLC